MPRGNPSPKVAVTIDPQIHEMATAAATRDGVSLSAWLTEAARRRLQNEAGLAAVLEYEMEYGAFTEEELARARAEVLEEVRDEARRSRKRRTA